jgi:hypothetical protein
MHEPLFDLVLMKSVKGPEQPNKLNYRVTATASLDLRSEGVAGYYLFSISRKPLV